MRHLFTVLISIIGLFVVLSPSGCQHAEEAPVLQQRLKGQLSVTSVPLRQALIEIDGKLWRDEYVIFGLELAPHKVPEPRVTLDLPAGTTVGEALAEVLRQAPDYDSGVVRAHLVDVWPRAWRNDPENVLNTRVPRFDAEEISPGLLLAYPWAAAPELEARMLGIPPGSASHSMGLRVSPDLHQSPEPKATFHLRDVTVREILNQAAQAASEAPPPWSREGWLYVYTAGVSDPFRAHSWMVLPTMRARSRHPR